MIDFQCRVAFEGQQCTINDCSLASPRTLARGVQDGGLYKLLVDLMALVHTNKKLGEPSSFEEAYAEHVWWDAMEIGSKPIVESMIDSKLAIDGSIEEYQDKVVGFSQKRGS
jgi:hypothetical protein